MNSADKDRPTPQASALALPAGTATWITPELVTLTLKVWQPFYRERLSAKDAVAMLAAVGRLLPFLPGRS